MYFLPEKINRFIVDLEKLIYSDREDISKYKVKEGNFSGGQSLSLDDATWHTYETGELWGGYDKHLWFRTKVIIPERFASKTVAFHITTGHEGEWDALNPQFLFYLDGELIQGLDVNHREVLISENVEPGREYNIAFLGYGGLYERKCIIHTELVVLDKEVEELYYDIKVPFNCAQLFKNEDQNRIDILNALNSAVQYLDLRKPFSEMFYESIRRAKEFLKVEFYEKLCGKNSAQVTAVGHTHLDIAWLWTLSQTREKAARSFSTAVKLMEQYPEYKFMASQPVLYKFIKEDYPELYEKIKGKIKEGNWEADGVMWLEPDCNAVSGESLVRQIIFGMRFFKEEYGVTCKTLWLPDVFGYTAALPQILRKSGIKYFMTTKLDWNQFNRIPYDSFMWEGIDGSKVYSHFVTTCEYDEQNKNKTRYEGVLNPSHVLGTWHRYQNKAINKEVLMTYGYGDGGGGANKEMLENGRRLVKGIPGMPALKLDFQANYFDRVFENISTDNRLPKWTGELYLEYHRGTYTSMGRTKRYNRKSELLYIDAEMLSALSYIAGREYPRKKLEEGWELILLNQFHDILPGSSIKKVYEDSNEQYEKVMSIGNDIVNSSLEYLSKNIKLSSRSLVVFNTLSYDRDDIVEFELADENIQICDGGGNILPYQTVDNGRKAVLFARGVPAKGYKALKIQTVDGTHSVFRRDVHVSENSLENKFFRIELDENKNISSLYYKLNGREILQCGSRGNVIQAFEDRPMRWENWDIDIYYKDKMWEVNEVVSCKVIENGPVRGCLRIERKFCDSTIVQDMYIYNDIPRIDFKTWVDWKEKNILLKASFPVDVHSNRASYDIQYGNVERDTHTNTSWDTARFEVCAHKWADLSEDGFGVSLLNDCKYGHDIKDSVMRLTLLKSGTYPNVDADREEHNFTYSLYPHLAGWREGATIKMAYNLNVPLYSRIEEAQEGILADHLSIASVDKENVVIEVIKRAENGDGIIIRLYECHNRREEVQLTFFKDIEEVRECDLLENKNIKHESSEGKFKFMIKPYEIKTFLLKY